jgi:hypothetical protein
VGVNSDPLAVAVRSNTHFKFNIRIFPYTIVKLRESACGERILADLLDVPIKNLFGDVQRLSQGNINFY